MLPAAMLSPSSRRRSRKSLPRWSFLLGPTSSLRARLRHSRNHDATFIINSLIAGAGIILLLSIVTCNWRNLTLILANLPFALVGGVLAVFATGGQLSLGGMVGFVTLFGVTLRNSVLMIAHYEHLIE